MREIKYISGVIYGLEEGMLTDSRTREWVGQAKTTWEKKRLRNLYSLPEPEPYISTLCEIYHRIIKCNHFIINQACYTK